MRWTQVATGMRPGDYPLGSLESRAAARAILKDSEPSQYDKDARILTSGCWLRSDMKPSYQDLEPTAIYKRGWELRHQDKASGKTTAIDTYDLSSTASKAGHAFFFAYGRGPAKGDVLRYDDVRLIYGPELNLLHLEEFISAWERQLTMTCPLKIEDGRVFRRIGALLRVDPPTWEEEKPRRDYEYWWGLVEREAGKEGIQGVVFEDEGACRPATEEELDGPPVKSDKGIIGILLKVARAD